MHHPARNYESDRDRSRLKARIGIDLSINVLLLSTLAGRGSVVYGLAGTDVAPNCFRNDLVRI